MRIRYAESLAANPSRAELREQLGRDFMISRRPGAELMRDGLLVIYAEGGLSPVNRERLFQYLLRKFQEDSP